MLVTKRQVPPGGHYGHSILHGKIPRLPRLPYYGRYADDGARVAPTFGFGLKMRSDVSEREKEHV